VQRAPFLVTFGLKWLVYGVLISIVNLRSLGVLVLGLVAVAAPLPVSVALWSVAFSFAVAFAAPRTLGHLGFGRYHQPHLEDRFFLFVDIRGSTTLAERIGPIAVHRFLAAVFGVASDPIADHGGEIYQYGGEIGDSKREIVFHGDVMNTAARLEQATRDLIDRSWSRPRRSAVSTGRSRTHGRPSDPGPSGAGRRRWRSTP